MSTPPPETIFQGYDDQSDLNKLAEKTKKSPLVPIGLAGLVGVLGIGAYKYKSRGDMSRSMFFMQLRVAAQGAVVGMLTLGIGYSLAKEYWFDQHDDSQNAKR